MPHIWKSVSLTLASMLGRSLSQLTHGQIENLARVYHKRESKGFEATELFARSLHDLANSSPNEFRLNGESWLIERTSKRNFTTIFDVGANIGDWTNYAARFHPGAKIHSFEIVPSTFARLRENTATLGDRVFANAFGLSDANGEVDVFVAPDNAYVSSMYDFGGVGCGKVKCKVQRGEDYARVNDIRKIDILKIDVEGAESRVLRGFGDMFTRGNIRLVQFEYNRGAIASRYLLIDFYDFFTQRGYVLGKLTPDGVIFRDYEYAYEDFNGPNYVACLAGDRELIDSLSLRR
jgi:FkbM family methyltransferase